MEFLFGNLYDFPEIYDLYIGPDSYPDLPELQIENQCKILSKLIQKYLKGARNILEMAAGPCYHSTELIKYGYNLSALDNSIRMIEFAKKRIKEIEGKNIRLILGDFLNYSSKEKYDVIISMTKSINLLTGVRDLKRHLLCSNKLLRANGLFIFDALDPKHIYSDLNNRFPNFFRIQRGRERLTVINRKICFYKRYLIKKYYIDLIYSGVRKSVWLNTQSKIRTYTHKQLTGIFKTTGFVLCGFYGGYNLKTKISDRDAYSFIGVFKKE